MYKIKRRYIPKQKCDMCNKIAYVYIVNITKELKEKWCEECINEEENWSKKLKELK